MNDDYNYERREDKLYTPGVDWGYPGLKIVAESGPFMLVRHGGYVGWSGIGLTTYYPIVFTIIKDLGPNPDSQRWRLFRRLKDREVNRSTIRRIKLEMTNDIVFMQTKEMNHENE